MIKKIFDGNLPMNSKKVSDATIVIIYTMYLHMDGFWFV